MSEKQASNALLTGIEHIVKEEIKKAPIDKTYTAIVKAVKDENLYDVFMQGQLYTNVSSIFKNLKINDTVKVKIPQNQYSSMYIEGKFNMDNTSEGGNSNIDKVYLAQPEPPTDKNVLWIDTDDNEKDKTYVAQPEPPINKTILWIDTDDNTTDIEIPTKTSQLTNDSGFLTQHQDISGKLDKNQGANNNGKILGINENGDVIPIVKPSGGGGSGTSDYTELINKPKINGNELNGNQTAEQLGLQPKGDYALKSDLNNKNDILDIVFADLGFDSGAGLDKQSDAYVEPPRTIFQQIYNHDGAIRLTFANNDTILLTKTIEKTKDNPNWWQAEWYAIVQNYVQGDANYIYYKLIFRKLDYKARWYRMIINNENIPEFNAIDLGFNKDINTNQQIVIAGQTEQIQQNISKLKNSTSDIKIKFGNTELYLRKTSNERWQTEAFTSIETYTHRVVYSLFFINKYLKWDVDLRHANNITWGFVKPVDAKEEYGWNVSVGVNTDGRLLTRLSKLKFTGGIVGEYDGSKELTVNIPTVGETEKYTLPIATNEILGGVKAKSKTVNDTVEVSVDENGKLYVPAYSSGGSGTSNYNDLINKPQINGHELSGNQTSEQLDLQPKYLRINASDLGITSLSKGATKSINSLPEYLKVLTTLKEDVVLVLDTQEIHLIYDNTATSKRWINISFYTNTSEGVLNAFQDYFIYKLSIDDSEVKWSSQNIKADNTQWGLVRPINKENKHNITVGIDSNGRLFANGEDLLKRTYSTSNQGKFLGINSSGQVVPTIIKEGVPNDRTIAGLSLSSNISVSELVNALKIEMLKIENPVGHIRIETSSTNPSTYLGFGTWVLWGQGKVPVGVDKTQTEFNSVEKTGGEKTHTLTEAEMPKHYHSVINDDGYSSAGRFKSNASAGNGWNVYSTGKSNNDKDFLVTGYAGLGQSHNNLQPYITCYMWKRTE